MSTVELSPAKQFLKDAQISASELAKVMAEILMNADLDTALGRVTKPYVLDVSENSIVKGTVISIKNDFILIDYGSKTEGVLPYHEDGQANDDLDMGDEAYFLVKEVNNDIAKLTRKNVEIMVRQQEVLSKTNIGDRVRVKLVNHTKNGWVTDLDGISAYLPFGADYLVYSDDPSSLLGAEIEADVEGIENGQVTLTRRAFATEVKKKVKKEFINSLNIGDLVDGVIKNLTEFGAFIQITSGIIGLCHASDFGKDEIKVGQKVKARVLKLDRDKNRVSLGVRQVTEPSWAEVVGKYNIDDKVIGRVKSIVPYGAFLEIESGVAGLVHVSDLSWSDHVKHPKEVLTEGQQIEVIILGIDVEKQHLSLGLKQVTNDPWETIADRYLIGSIVEGVVTNKTKFGIFIEIERGVEGLAHHTVDSKNLKLGEKISCSIVRIDLDRKKISLALEE